MVLIKISCGTHVFKSSMNKTDTILNEFTKVTKVSEVPVLNSSIYNEDETIVDIIAAQPKAASPV